MSAYSSQLDINVSFKVCPIQTKQCTNNTVRIFYPLQTICRQVWKVNNIECKLLTALCLLVYNVYSTNIYLYQILLLDLVLILLGILLLDLVLISLGYNHISCLPDQNCFSIHSIVDHKSVTLLKTKCVPRLRELMEFEPVVVCFSSQFKPLPIVSMYTLISLKNRCNCILHLRVKHYDNRETCIEK